MGVEMDMMDAVHGRIDITNLDPIVRHPVMQVLRRVQQLGGIEAVFPGANHTRFSHCLGVCHIVQRRTDWLVAQGRLEPNEALAAVIAGLVHDVGHYPFSHIVEPFLGDHDERTLRFVENELADAIVASGGNPALVRLILEHKHPLSGLVLRGSLAADRLDYLQRDALAALGARWDLRDFYTTHVTWEREAGLCLLSRGLADYCRLVDGYYHAYTKLYERTSCRAAERYLQEMVRRAWGLIDGLPAICERGGEHEVIGAIAAWSRENPTESLARRYQSYQERGHPQRTFVLMEDPRLASSRPGRGRVALPCERWLIERSASWGLDQLEVMEANLAETLTIAPWELSIAPAPPSRRWRLTSQLVMTTSAQMVPVEELLPELGASAQMYRRQSASIIVCLTRDHRTRLAGDAGVQRVVLELLESQSALRP